MACKRRTLMTLKKYLMDIFLLCRHICLQNFHMCITSCGLYKVVLTLQTVTQTYNRWWLHRLHLACQICQKQHLILWPWTWPKSLDSGLDFDTDKDLFYTHNKGVSWSIHWKLNSEQTYTQTNSTENFTSPSRRKVIKP